GLALQDRNSGGLHELALNTRNPSEREPHVRRCRAEGRALWRHLPSRRREEQRFVQDHLGLHERCRDACYESPLQRRLCLGDIGPARTHPIRQRPKAVHGRGRHRAFLRGNHDCGGGWPGLSQKLACGSAEPHVTPLECAAISDFGKTLLGLLCGLAAAAIWGGGSAVLRHLVTSGLGPADLTLLRYVGCFPVALAALFLMGDRIWLGITWPRLAFLLIIVGPLYHAIVVA